MKKIGTLALTLAVALGLTMTAAAAPSFKGEIKIGAILPISGAISAYGVQTRDAIQLAFDQVNAKGGVLGKKLVLIAEDDENVPDKTVNAFKKLTSQDGVKVIIGGLTSKCTLAITAQAQAAKIVLISPTATNDKVTDAGDYIFRACYKDSFQGEVVAKFAATTLKAKVGAVIYDNTNDYSKGLDKSFEAAFAKNGGKIALSVAYSNGDSDFSAQLTKIKGAKPDVIFIPDYYSTVALIAQQARDLGIKAVLLGGDGWDEITNNAGDEVVGCFYSNHYSTDANDKEVKDFISAFSAKFNGTIPNALAALGYDCGNIVADAIALAKKDSDAAAIRDAMKKTNKKFVTGKIKFDAQNNPVKSVVILEIVKKSDGKLDTKYKETVNP
jgi:branched-chain amino acid transport system substrate-binding protein